ncbi:MAG: D-alanine--D-alanine ligase [Bacteroidales bacterium]|jgi:D-alanine-D-alanine ligase|nr:D-alanine--D-alanine ligase [Bacteroidales bacterium]MCK9498384.1 D-alanine--D-alanine ligase [Bacteroidales bacterium]MDY0314184.1 D-alanine--D-alanine ligase [Bacteroidales bacterium]NLB86368.1 D-alanine--D-alanine ligase [Bacteroidales bacterium]
MKNIAVLAGGYSSERQISLNSGMQVLESLDKTLYNAYLVEVNIDGFFCVEKAEKFPVNLNDFSCNLPEKMIKFDFAYIVIHGSPGEDGKIQAYLDILNIPYSSCSVYASVISFNKLACKNILKDTGVYLAKSMRINKNKNFSLDELVEEIGLPCFVKPNTAGSSYGVTKVYEKDKLIEAINHAAKEDDTIIVEEFIQGIEVSCGILKTNKNEIVFPVTEIFTKNDYFDTEAKYKPELTDEITPARISDEETKAVQDFTSFIYDILELSGIVRIDYIIKNNKPYFLEVNSIPGMSAESIIPKQIRTINKSVKEILSLVIESKFNKDL